MIARWILPACALALLAAGCAAPARHLDPADAATWNRLNDRAADRAPEIRLRGEESSVSAPGARFAADTTRWAGDEPGVERSVGTGDIARISFHSHRIGAIRGAQGGLCVGLVGAVGWILMARADGEVDEGAFLVTALLTPVATGTAGALAGALVGGDEVFLLGESPPDTRYLPGSGAPAPDYVKRRQE